MKTPFVTGWTHVSRLSPEELAMERRMWEGEMTTDQMRRRIERAMELEGSVVTIMSRATCDALGMWQVGVDMVTSDACALGTVYVLTDEALAGMLPDWPEQDVIRLEVGK